MKTLKYTLLILSVLVLWSCEYNRPIRFGFSSEIEKGSSGLTIMAVERWVTSVYLEGSVNVEEGEVEICILNPEGVAVFDSTLQAPVSIYFDEEFKAISGMWRLKYESREGLGQIDLHLNF